MSLAGIRYRAKLSLVVGCLLIMHSFCPLSANDPGVAAQSEMLNLIHSYNAVNYYKVIEDVLFGREKVPDGDQSKIGVSRIIWFEGSVTDFENIEGETVIQVQTNPTESFGSALIIGKIHHRLARRDFIDPQYGEYSLLVLGKIIKRVNVGSNMSPSLAPVVKIYAMRIGSKLVTDEAILGKSGNMKADKIVGETTTQLLHKITCPLLDKRYMIEKDQVSGYRNCPRCLEKRKTGINQDF